MEFRMSGKEKAREKGCQKQTARGDF